MEIGEGNKHFDVNSYRNVYRSDFKAKLPLVE
jgi:hypothetical protein